MARGCIADAQCVNKAAEGREDEIIPCLKCFVCLSYDMEEEFCCSANPTVGREYILDQFENKNSTPKRVAVIGGGPAGMAAAQFCTERGHKVTLYEKDTKLGGTINFAKYATFKYSLDDYMNYRIHMMDKLGVDVRLGVEATPEMIEAEGYDVVMTAMGASNIVLPIPGHDDPRVICAVDAFGNADKIGQKVVLIGGGEVGCEAALYLAMECGKDVSIIEMMDRIAATSAYCQELALYDRVPKYCHLYLSSPVTQITPTQVGYKGTDGVEHFLDADTVIFSSGRKPLEDQAEKFRNCAPKFFKLGDCAKASNIRNANRMAYDAAAQI
jgi:NADPH-dependent 2,4-dienoyl-CoA reductase/sulfur reductase-like enzyme